MAKDKGVRDTSFLYPIYHTSTISHSIQQYTLKISKKKCCINRNVHHMPLIRLSNESHRLTTVVFKANERVCHIKFNISEIKVLSADE